MAQIEALLGNKAGVAAMLVALVIGARVGAISSNELYPAWAWRVFAPRFSVLEAVLIAAMMAACAARYIIWPAAAATATAAVAAGADTMPVPTAATAADTDRPSDGAETPPDAPGLEHADPAPVPSPSGGKLSHKLRAIAEDDAVTDSGKAHHRHDAGERAAGNTVGRARSAPAAPTDRADAPEYGTPMSATAARVRSQENGAGYGNFDIIMTHPCRRLRHHL